MTVEYDSKSFIVNGERVFLTSGSIHYFRVPRACWRDRLEKAKAAGLNTVQSYVAWNWHEREEGVFDFTGERDLEHFIALAEELGLFLVARPGPYICAEWDFGGFPTWLMRKKGLRLRHYDPLYLHYVDRYLDHVLPIIARHQATRGGGVILVQAENELGLVAPEDGALYMRHLVDGFEARGIEVPIITCVGGTAETIECVNGHQPADQFAKLREKQPDAPIHCTEFWPGWYRTWDKPVEDYPQSPAKVERETWRVLAEGGAGYNYYMWHGGTNFAYTAMYLQTTSYDYTAPLSEAGGIWEKYRRCRRVALFAQTFAQLLTEADEGDFEDIERDMTLDVRYFQRVAPDGRILFVHNPGESRQAVYLSVNGIPFDLFVPGEAVRPVVYDVPFGVDLESSPSLALCTAGILGLWRRGSETQLVVYGDPGVANRAILSFMLPGRPAQSGDIAGEWQDGLWTTTLAFANEPRAATLKGDSYTIRILALPTHLADRTWWDPALPCGAIPELFVGPYYRRADGTLEFTSDDKLAWSYRDGALSRLDAPAAELPEPPTLGEWQYVDGEIECREDFDDSAGVGMFEPINRVLLDGEAGYSWYRAAIESESEREATLTLTAFADRAIVFLNGEHLISTAAPPEHRAHDPMLSLPIRLRAGLNALAILTDNLGHVKGSWMVRGRPQEEDRKGLFGPVTLDHEIPVTHWRFFGGLTGEREGWVLPHVPSAVEGVVSGAIGRPAPTWHPGAAAAPGKRLRWYRSTFSISAEERAIAGREIFLDLSGMRKGVLWVNGINLGRYWTANGDLRYYVPKAWLADQNEVILFEEEPVEPARVRLVWDEKAKVATRQSGT